MSDVHVRTIMYMYGKPAGGQDVLCTCTVHVFGRNGHAEKLFSR